MIAFVIVLLVLIALIARQHHLSYPHIDDVLAELDHEDAGKNHAKRSVTLDEVH